MITETTTQTLLRKYSWETRFQEEHSLLPHEEFIKVSEIIQTNFTQDFSFEGNIPWISFSNLLGLRKDIMKTDDDSVIGIVAPPGKGKSTFTLSCARFLDKTFTNERTIFTMEQLKRFLKKASLVYNQIKEANSNGEKYSNPYSGRVVVIDEGLYMLFSGDAGSKDGKIATKLFSIIRALGIIFMINITNWKRISKGVKEDRFKALFRIPVKGIVQFFSQARISRIRVTKESMEWPTPNFFEKIGKINHNCQFWKEYDNKKSSFLQVAIHDID